MMNRTWMAGLMLTAVCVAAATALASGPQPAGEPLLIDGEKLTYEIFYGSIPAGHAWLEVDGRETDQGDVYRITSVARSNDIISLFFKVEDMIMAEVDASTFEPRYFEKRLREGPFRRDERAVYGRDGTVRSREKIFKVEPGTRDILSALYYVRGQELRVGQEIRIKTFEGGKPYEARVKVLGRERVSTDRGDYECLVVEPEILEGAFAKTGKIRIWLTDDRLKLPVLMKSKVKIGSFVARLVGSQYTGGE